MRFNLFLGLLPCVLALNVPAESALWQSRKLQTGSTCDDPSANFLLEDLSIKSRDGGKHLTSYEFRFKDAHARIETLCQFNKSSQPIESHGSHPRYACSDSRVQFIYVDEQRSLDMIEVFCAQKPPLELSGSLTLPFACHPVAGCHLNGTAKALQGNFTSLEPSPVDPSASSQSQ